MKNISFVVGAEYGELALRMDFAAAGPAIKMGFKKMDFRESYKWAKDFAQKLKARLLARFVEEPVWTSLRLLTTIAPRRSDGR